MSENVCCPELMVVDCADTDEHKHLVCRYSKALLDNDTIVKICIKGFRTCVLRSGLEVNE